MEGCPAAKSSNISLHGNSIYVIVQGNAMNDDDTKQLEADLKCYLLGVLSLPVDPAPWAEAQALPLILRDAYAFSVVSLFGTSCLLLLDRGAQHHTPASIRKHLLQIERRWVGEVVYVKRAVDSYNRKRLIEHKIPFVIPGNQMYLPAFGLDLREHFRRTRRAVTSFSPSTQATMLYALNNRLAGPVSPLDLAGRLGYSRMTMTRVFNELEEASVGEHSTRGKRRLVEFPGARRALWDNALPFLRTPVLKRLHVGSSVDSSIWPGAGLSALSMYASLAEPKNPVAALAGRAWVLLRNRYGTAEIPAAEPDSVEIELWSYPPELLATGGTVDRLSLYLSLMDTVDERVEAAREELLEGVEW